MKKQTLWTVQNMWHIMGEWAGQTLLGLQYQDIGYCTYFQDKLKIKWILNGVVVPFDSSVKKKENIKVRKL